MSDLQYRQKLLQNVREHDAFLNVLRNERVNSYLEIGAMYGGSLWRVATALPKGSRVVAVDFMCDTPEARPSLDACIHALNAGGYHASAIYGDSTDTATIEAVQDEAPYDCLFIDGAHTLEAVTADWDNYGPMARIVAFHDIAWNDTWKSAVPGRAPKAMGVPEVWNKLKAVHPRHCEFKFQKPSNYYGIGVLWRD